MWYTKMIVRGSAVFPRYIGQISISIEVYRDMNVFKKIFGTSSQREVKAIMPLVDKVLALEEEYKALSDHELQAKTGEFKERLQKGETLDDILPEAFAACREADWRVLGMRPYPVQIIGGIILHQGRIAEMKTGEGKTLVATLPAYLNALSGKGVHIVTVNDYLAKRDSEWMGKVYRFMGLTVGLVIHGVMGQAKKDAYAADITYGTNNEFGFDYLRDNMAIYAQELVQRGHSFAIVDEVDSILIDEARTPLIISGQGDKSTQLYTVVDAFVAKLKGQRVASVDTKEEEDPDLDADYVVDEKARTVTLTAREFEILALLMEYPKKVFTREQIYQHVWGEDYFGDDNTVNVHISNLRSKLGKASDREYIKTVWGIGFKMSDL